MGRRYRVTAGYVTVETAVPGGRAQIDIPHGQVLPADVPAEQVATALRLGHVEPVDEQPAPPAGPTTAVDEPPGPADGTVTAVLDRVGGDPAKAQVALDAERAKGDRARKTLVDALVEIAGREQSE